MPNYQEFFEASINNSNNFWKEQSEDVDWFTSPKKILDASNAPLYKWFEDGELNTSYLALDFHIEQGRGDQLALIYDSPVTGTKKQYTFSQLRDEVALVAGMLQKMGVDKGDRIIIYMPMIPETIFAMLACARIGAVHSVVFGGFSSKELAIRIDSAEPKVLLTASCGIEINKVIPYKPLVDGALEIANHQVKTVIIYQREALKAELKEGRDYNWSDLREISLPVKYVKVKSTDPLYIIYTSGTTGKPKGVVRDNGGHAVAMKFSMKYVYGAGPGDVFWSASDVGWVVGHSYIVYGPLIAGCTTIIFEGKPIKTPDAGTFWRIIEEYKVNKFFTAPTAFRAIKKEDPEGALMKNYDISSLKHLFLAGERCDVATLKWLQGLTGIPIIDHWWQTESGWPMIANMVGLELLPVKPGSACKSVCGYKCVILDNDGKEVGPNEEGALVVQLPLPPGCLTNLWRNTERYMRAYMTQYEGYFFSGDTAYMDDEGYIFITGRMDDIINVAGHRLSTATMEEVVSSHKAIAECAVIGVEDQMKGQIPVGIVVVKDGQEVTEQEIKSELVQMVREAVGPVASFKRVVMAKRLPKTRSGKILRKTMRAIADGKSFSVPSTIEDATVLDEIKELLKS